MANEPIRCAKGGGSQDEAADGEWISRVLDLFVFLYNIIFHSIAIKTNLLMKFMLIISNLFGLN